MTSLGLCGQKGPAEAVRLEWWFVDAEPTAGGALVAITGAGPGLTLEASGAGAVDAVVEGLLARELGDIAVLVGCAECDLDAFGAGAAEHGGDRVRRDCRSGPQPADELESRVSQLRVWG